MKNILIEFLRWILVLPVSALVYYIIIFVVLVSNSFTNYEYYTLLTVFFAGASAGGISVFVGVLIAPRFKIVTAIILGLILLLLFSHFIYSWVTNYDGWFVVERVTNNIGTIIGGIIACIYLIFNIDKVTER